MLLQTYYNKTLIVTDHLGFTRYKKFLNNKTVFSYCFYSNGTEVNTLISSLIPGQRAKCGIATYAAASIDIDRHVIMY